MPYNFVANNFYAKQLSSRLSSPKTAVLRVSFLWGLKGNVYDDHFRFIGKRVGKDISISVNWC